MKNILKPVKKSKAIDPDWQPKSPSVKKSNSKKSTKNTVKNDKFPKTSIYSKQRVNEIGGFDHAVKLAYKQDAVTANG